MVDLPQSVSRSAPRVIFVDALRLLAALQMIQGHTLDALLADASREGSWFGVWSYVRGFTSVAFLLTAGLAFGLATRTPESLRSGRPRRVMRALQLIVLGYALHAPLGVFFGDDPAKSLRGAAAVDILQCIGVSLLLLELACGVLMKPLLRAWLSLGVATLCFALAPWSEALEPKGASLAWLDYFSARGGSLFPLVPWSGFVWFGLMLSQVVPPSRAHSFGGDAGATARPAASSDPPSPGRRRRSRPPRPRARGWHGWRAVLGVAAMMTFGLGAGLSALMADIPGRVSPAQALLKLGVVLTVAALLAGWLEGRALPTLLRRLSSETLFLYVSHVLILYAGHMGLATQWGRSLNLAEALVVTLCLGITCSAGALGYRRAQRALRGQGQRGTPRAQPSSFPG